MFAAGCRYIGAEPHSQRSTFSLRVLEETYAPDARGEFSLNVRDGERIEVVVRVDGASGLTAAIVELSYDPALLSPVSAEATGELRSGASDPTLLELTVLHESGVVSSAQALAHMHAQPGISGSAEMARIVFERRPFVATRGVSLAPKSDLSRSRTRFEQGNTLSWGYYNQADYDQNSEVNGADLVPISKYFRATGPWADDAIQRVVVGDGNGEINGADIAPIAGNFRRSVGGYRIYSAPTPAGYPASNEAPSTADMLAELAYDTYSGNRAEQRVRYDATLNGAQPGHYYWVRPFHGTHEGTPGEMVQLGVTNVAPTAQLSADPSSGGAPLQVQFDAGDSSDSDGSIVRYEFDLDGDGVFEHDNGASPLVEFTYTTLGAVTAGVRVTDDGGASATAGVGIEVSEPGDPPTAVLRADPRYGPVPLLVTFDAGFSFGEAEIVRYEFDFDGDGDFEHDNADSTVVQHSFPDPGVFDSAVRVTDAGGLQSTAVMLVMPTADGNFPPPDSIFVLPSRSYASAGEIVTLEVHAKSMAQAFCYLSACMVTFEAGNLYERDSFNVGAIGGAKADIDGIWPQLDPSAFLLAPDEFLNEDDVGGGRRGLLFNITPLNATEVPDGSGALFNFGLVVNSDVSLSFLRYEEMWPRTYYQNYMQIENTHWSNDDNAGLPGITLQP